MARRKKSAPEHVETQQDATSSVPETPQPSAPPALTEPSGSHVEREQSRRQHGEPQAGVTKNQAQPNPFSGDQISLTPERGGPQMRFIRARYNPTIGIRRDENAIQFEAKPAEEDLQKLRDAGWSYAARDKVWKKPLGENRASEEVANHRFFIELGNAIRERSGMEPVVSLGNARA